jgi:hypothetical protein
MLQFLKVSSLHPPETSLGPRIKQPSGELPYEVRGSTPASITTYLRAAGTTLLYIQITTVTTRREFREDFLPSHRLCSRIYGDRVFVQDK